MYTENEGVSQGGLWVRVCAVVRVGLWGKIGVRVKVRVRVAVRIRVRLMVKVKVRDKVRVKVRVIRMLRIRV